MWWNESGVLPDELTELQKLPLDWEQILTVWVVAAGAILGSIWLIKLVSSDLSRSCAWLGQSQSGNIDAFFSKAASQSLPL
jgi:hypothetical protein